MKTCCQVVLAAVALVTAVPGSATAHPTYHYIGGCDARVVGDGTDSPQTNWSGTLVIAASATDTNGLPTPTTSITVECELVINNNRPGAIVASASGIGSAAVVQEFSYYADPDDHVALCEIVTVGGEVHQNCSPDEIHTAVLGYIEITDDGTGPTYTLIGELAGPTWSCGESTSTSPPWYAVTCTPRPSATRPDCAVLHAAVSGLSPAARARTSMDCTGDSAFEAQTAVVGGVNHDSVAAIATVTVASLTCRVDGGSLPSAPTWQAACGDPGLVRLGT